MLEKTAYDVSSSSNEILVWYGGTKFPMVRAVLGCGH
jgi:hypothetical protein